MKRTIWGKYEGKKEIIDQADNKEEADYLVQEYKLAFGPDWIIWSGRYVKDQED